MTNEKKSPAHFKLHGEIFLKVIPTLVAMRTKH